LLWVHVLKDFAVGICIKTLLWVHALKDFAVGICIKRLCCGYMY
jgi:hypothetical protein